MRELFVKLRFSEKLAVLKKLRYLGKVRGKVAIN